MLDSLSIKKVACYCEAGIDIRDLKKINFIYGTNGTGKTTISNFLAEPGKEEFQSCSLKWQTPEPLQCLVYNKAFRKAHFDQGPIPGVFTLGQATAEEIKEIENKNVELQNLLNEVQQTAETLKKLEADLETTKTKFQDKVWSDILKKYEPHFREAFQGALKPKKLFKNTLLQKYESIQPVSDDFAALKKRADTIFGDAPTRLPQLPKIAFVPGNAIESDDIWKQKIIGKSDVPIAAFIQSLNINDWVNEGRRYLQDDEKCPFCQEKTISKTFRTQLESYFDDAFSSNIDKVNTQAEKYFQLSSSLLNDVETVLQNERTNKLSKLDIVSFEAAYKTFRSEIETNKERISAKKKEPSRNLTLVPTKESISSLSQLVDGALAEIKSHNDIVDNLEREKEQLKTDIWNFVCNEAKDTIEEFKKSESGQSKGIHNVGEKLSEKRRAYTELKIQIERLTENTTSVQPSVDKINTTLKHFGFLNFKVVPSAENSKQYQLQREDGSLAGTTLSEGEITFITFLYYLQLAQGAKIKEDVAAQRILVIDDPISSLDSNILFVISTLIKGIIRDVKKGSGTIQQVFLLTHNVYFHKEVSFIDGRTDKCSDVHYWLLRKNPKNTSVIPHKQNNPVKSSYELLWREVREWKGEPTVTLQNSMRRIIENFFKLVGKYGDDHLIQQFETKEEQEICRSLVCWINDGSHCVNDDLYIEHQDAMIDTYLTVFRQIFIHTKNEGHYEMMMGIPLDENPGTS